MWGGTRPLIPVESASVSKVLIWGRHLLNSSQAKSVVLGALGGRECPLQAEGEIGEVGFLFVFWPRSVWELSYPAI